MSSRAISNYVTELEQALPRALPGVVEVVNRVIRGLRRAIAACVVLDGIVSKVAELVVLVVAVAAVALVMVVATAILDFLRFASVSRTVVGMFVPW